MEKNSHREWLCLRLETQVLNEFLIGQELYGNWLGSYQSSGPMRNSFNVFVGVRKRQGRGKR
jgi:serine/threonine protein kinase HipA of HipAB toxin-antitoxin module